MYLKVFVRLPISSFELDSCISSKSPDANFSAFLVSFSIGAVIVFAKKKPKIIEITIDTTSSNTEAGPGPHKHEHGTIEGSGKCKVIGTIINTDTLVVGDYVKVIPCQDGQMWFVDSKYRKVKE